MQDKFDHESLSTNKMDKAKRVIYLKNIIIIHDKKKGHSPKIFVNWYKKEGD